MPETGPTPEAEDTDAALIQKHGIERSTVDYFHVGPYRYTNLRDAVASAERMQKQK